MADLTITEALAEITTIGKRLEKKRNAINPFLVRDSRILDPLAKDGGSEKFIAAERQAIGDLEKRVIALRTAIQRKNLDLKVTVREVEMSVAEWLTWKREVAEGQRDFINTMVGNIARGKATIQAPRGVSVSQPADNPPQVVVALDEKTLMQDQELLEALLGELDGKLSLFNATQTISV